MLSTNLKVLSGAKEIMNSLGDMMHYFFLFPFASCLHFICKVRQGTSPRGFGGAYLHIYCVFQILHAAMELFELFMMAKAAFNTSVLSYYFETN